MNYTQRSRPNLFDWTMMGFTRPVGTGMLPDVFSRRIVVALLTQFAVSVICAVPNAQADTSLLTLAAIELSGAADQIKPNINYNFELLRLWPHQDKGKEVLENLKLLIQKVGSQQLDAAERSDTFAELYRCLGGAQLISSSVPDSIRRALPYLARSLELNPNQLLLKQNVEIFQRCLATKRIDVRLLLTNELQVLRGSEDPEIPTIVEELASYALGQEFRAQHWLLYEATTPPIASALEYLQKRIRNEIGLDVRLDFSSAASDNGIVDVTAQLGSNTFVWVVDFGKRTYSPKNQFTDGFMARLLSHGDSSTPVRIGLGGRLQWR